MCNEDLKYLSYVLDVVETNIKPVQTSLTLPFELCFLKCKVVIIILHALCVESLVVLIRVVCKLQSGSQVGSIGTFVVNLLLTDPNCSKVICTS